MLVRAGGDVRRELQHVDRAVSARRRRRGDVDHRRSRGLPAHRDTPLQLLHGASVLWLANILIFALWYWRLDAGGPHKREKVFGHPQGSFLFPQMTMPPAAKDEADQTDWSPNFIDYLFIAFNTSTAFSPTDVPVLARWAKVLMMLQSVISLSVIALLAARAVNTF